MKKIFTLIVFIALPFLVFSQSSLSITGSVKTKDGSKLTGASVVLYALNTKDSLKKSTDDRGNFSFVNLDPGFYSVVVTYVGYDGYQKLKDLTGNTGEVKWEEIILQPGTGMLSNFTLEAQKVQIKEDTVSYVVDSTMYRKNDNVETMLKNLPGVQVDKDGTITAQGKQVTKVKVNGKDFFGGDVTTATRELNADMVDRIQIIDDYGDQAAFTGIKDGDPSKTLNIQLKKDKNKGIFGNVSAGKGTFDRYLGSVSTNYFNNSRQISLISNLNNTNTSQFNFGGGGGGGGGMGGMMAGMARSMGIGRGGGGVASLMGNFGNSDGITDNKSIGVNYRDEWGTRVSVYGNYSYAHRSTSTIRSSVQENFFSNRSSTYSQQSDNLSTTDNHRFNFNVEFKPDTNNYWKINPSITYSKNNTGYYSEFDNLVSTKKLSDGSLRDTSLSNTPNLSGSILYNHKFKKRGRTISTNLNFGNNQSESEENYNNRSVFYDPLTSTPKDSILLQYITQDNTTRNYSARISYTEPLTLQRNLEINYGYSWQEIGNDRKNYFIDPVTGAETFVDQSSNIYTNTLKNHRIGMNLRTTLKKYNYTIGLTAQPSTITTNSITAKTIFTNNVINYNPVIRFAYNFSKSRSLNINYNGNTSQPSNTQLQPITDRSNPQFITIGNPSLKPEFANTFSMRYNNFDYISGNVFFGNISFSYTKDKIVNSTKLQNAGIQETRYLNTDGYYFATAFYNISRPYKNRKYVINLGGNVSYFNNVSYIRDINDQDIRNIGKNWVAGQRLAVDIKIKKWLETNLTVNYSINSFKNNLQTELNSNAVNWVLSHNSRIFLPKDFIISYDADKTFFNGYSGNNQNINPFIINATIEKQLLEKKNLSIKLQGFDLLKENVGINRNVSSNGFTDTRTNRLGNYYMLGLVWRINKFKGDMQQGGMGNPMMQGGGEMRMRF